MHLAAAKLAAETQAEEALLKKKQEAYQKAMKLAERHARTPPATATRSRLNLTATKMENLTAKLPDGRGQISKSPQPQSLKAASKGRGRPKKSASHR